MNAFRFGQNVLRKEGFNQWKVAPCKMGGGARVSKNRMEIRIDIKSSEDYALILHEIAHIVSARLTNNCHDVLFADALTQLMRKYMLPNKMWVYEPIEEIMQA